MLSVKQTDIADCGVACVKSILHHYEILEDLHRIKMHHPIKLGFYSFQELSDIFENYNLVATGYSGDFESLLNIEKPIIAHTRIYGILSHFIVIEKISETTIYYMDPAYGKNLTMSKSKFISIWTSKILVINHSPHKGAYISQKVISQNVLSFLLNKRTLIIILISSLFFTLLLVKYLSI